MGTSSSGWWGKGRKPPPSHLYGPDGKQLPPSAFTREKIRASLKKYFAERQPLVLAKRYRLSEFEPSVGEFLARIGWRPFNCQSCGAYKLGPLTEERCGLCAPIWKERSAFGRPARTCNRVSRTLRAPRWTQTCFAFA